MANEMKTFQKCAEKNSKSLYGDIEIGKVVGLKVHIVYLYSVRRTREQQWILIHLDSKRCLNLGYHLKTGKVLI